MLLKILQIYCLGLLLCIISSFLLLPGSHNKHKKIPSTSTVFGECCPGKGPVSSALKNKPFVIYPRHFSSNKHEHLHHFKSNFKSKIHFTVDMLRKKVLLHFCPTLGLWQKILCKNSASTGCIKYNYNKNKNK